MTFLLALCLLLPADDDARAILREIGHTVSESLGRSDNYICAQDLSRFYYTNISAEASCKQPPTLPATPLVMQDRLKLDVAVSQGNEIYSWRGDRKFSAASVSDVVSQGPISSGSFIGYLRNIFGERGVKFELRGRSKVNDLELFHFDFQVPLASSHYDIQTGNGFERASFHGSFSARTDNFHLYSLTVTAEGEKLSSKTSICAAETRLTYQQVKIADHESLVPASFDLLIGSRRGFLTESKGTYTSCREYRGESTFSFDIDDSATAAVKPAELQSEPLRAGLLLPIMLRTEIDEDSSYAGLPVEATLQHDVKLNNGEKLLRGAILRGTLTEIQIFHQPSHLVTLRLQFNSITDGTKLYLCAATHHSEAEFLQPSMGRNRRMSPVAIRTPTDGSIVFPVKHLHLTKYGTELITLAP